MGLLASSHVSSVSDSREAAGALAKKLREDFSKEPLNTVVVYATVNHDAETVLATLKDALGEAVQVLGCSSQGIVAQGVVDEGAYSVGVMGFGGSDLRAASSVAREIANDTKKKGEELADALLNKLGAAPKVAFLLYDPLCRADVETLLEGFAARLSCPVVGGGASQPWGPMVRTYQYWNQEVLGHGAIALALGGPLAAEVGVCHGTSPTGIEMTLTRAEGNKLLEIDGRPALDIWKEVTGAEDDQITHQDYTASWAVGVKPTGLDNTAPQYVIRAAFGLDLTTGAVIVQAAIPQGTRIMFHHRTVPAVTRGTIDMGNALAARLGGRRPWAALGFECLARTQAFLGQAATLKENLALQSVVAPTTPWLGLQAMGEVAPLSGKPAFHNYTYPLALLVEA
jgi:hypothetical protein